MVEENKSIKNAIPEWAQTFNISTVSAEEAVKKINPGHRVFVSTGCSQPNQLLRAMAARAHELADVEIIQLLAIGDIPYLEKGHKENFKINSFFISEGIRDSINKGLGSYTPILLSDIPRLFSGGQLALDLSLIQVSPPDNNGMCSLGISVDIIKAAIENSRLVVAQINNHMPRTYGDSAVSINEIDVFVPYDEPLIEVHRLEIRDDIKEICIHIAALIESGSTLQLGFGTIPQITLEYLKDKRDLGVHSEMISDRIVELIESGVINGKKKSLDRGKIVTSFCMGTKRLYDLIDHNAMFSFRRTEYVNDIEVIGRQTKMVAVNTAIEIDLTGQVCADSLGTKFISGIGGQADFVRGANRSDRGKSIIALPSTARNGKITRIVAQLTPGGGVVNTRGDIHYVVTEFGTAYLHGKNIQERAMALISIAHPSFRSELLKKAIEYGYVVPSLAEVEGKLLVQSKELTTTMLLDDGTKVKFRPIHPTDMTKMRDLLYRLSEGTVYYRFGWNIKEFTQKQIQNFVYVDHRKEVAIVGTVPGAAEEEIIALSGYYLDEKTNRAEVALVVLDEWQNRGIGTFMLKYLTQIAQKNGIRGFTAEIHVTNRKMQTVMHKSSGTVESTLDGPVFSMRSDFQ
ncbi:MAG: GNAT family N-acetyltransferase [Deltaproteobacteria bacterium]|nr:GNAT family N-acetyltransferase [Deltaproteobacteria bacterium]